MSFGGGRACLVDTRAEVDVDQQSQEQPTSLAPILRRNQQLIKAAAPRYEPKKSRSEWKGHLLQEYQELHLGREVSTTNDIISHPSQLRGAVLCLAPDFSTLTVLRGRSLQRRATADFAGVLLSNPLVSILGSFHSVRA